MRGEHISFYVVFCSSCVQRDYYYRGRLHTDFEEKDWEREKFFVCFYITCGPTTQRERERERSFVWERKILKFLLCHNEWMRGEHKFLCSFCRSCVLRDYYYDGRLHRFWRRKTAREKRKNVCFHHYIIGGPPQREEILREIKMKRFLNFYYATTNEWMRGEHKFL